MLGQTKCTLVRVCTSQENAHHPTEHHQPPTAAKSSKNACTLFHFGISALSHPRRSNYGTIQSRQAAFMRFRRDPLECGIATGRHSAAALLYCCPCYQTW